jgi:hypothetical protein
MTSTDSTRTPIIGLIAGRRTKYLVLGLWLVATASARHASAVQCGRLAARHLIPLACARRGFRPAISNSAKRWPEVLSVTVG